MAKSLIQTLLECKTTEGDSPVEVNDMSFLKSSRASWIRGLNTAGLTANPK